MTTRQESLRSCGFRGKAPSTMGATCKPTKLICFVERQGSAPIPEPERPQASGVGSGAATHCSAIHFPVVGGTAESLRRRPSPGQDRTLGHPRPVRAVGRSRRLRGGAGGVTPCQSPWEAPGWGAGLPESPRPATGGTRTHTQSQDPGSRPVPCLRQGGRDREGAGQGESRLPTPVRGIAAGGHDGFPYPEPPEAA